MHEVLELTNNELVGLWEYSVLTEDGQWTLILTRGEETNPSKMIRQVDYTRYHMNMELKFEGETLFDTDAYPNSPFAQEYDLNPFMVCAAVNNLADWYMFSASYYQVAEALAGSLPPGMEVAGFVPIGEKFSVPINRDQMEKLQHHGDTSYRLFLALWDYAMANTTPEWRETRIGTANPEPSEWSEPQS